MTWVTWRQYRIQAAIAAAVPAAFAGLSLTGAGALVKLGAGWWCASCCDFEVRGGCFAFGTPCPPGDFP